ncbi:MAG: DUF1318 domain-containing protein [Desulfobacterales bacterium]
MKKSLCVILILMFGCTLAKVKVEVLSERTTLENQVLGTYNSLDREMLLAASVRGVDSSGQIQQPPRQSQEYQDTLAAMQVQAFHADDIETFKRLGWVGENNTGLLTAFVTQKGHEPDDLKAFAERYTAAEFNSVVKQVNNARKTVMHRVVELNENLTDADMPEIEKIFWKINIENALPGEKIETEDGTWIKKK